MYKHCLIFVIIRFSNQQLNQSLSAKHSERNNSQPFQAWKAFRRTPIISLIVVMNLIFPFGIMASSWQSSQKRVTQSSH
ncbi:hypothetical protein FGO68_gene7864 [Halteria grandinella]|uniref:Uncharacterized protein n=1 Tax=Halteria grandinella TaxID=5974 RepID=A0A8J8T867_HALGN|nr:hypothetical protein FGO68_gene7864 [Halteria grandinella]